MHVVKSKCYKVLDNWIWNWDKKLNNSKIAII